VNKPRGQIDADGSRWLGDGPIYIVFLENGDVVLDIRGERAEHRALIKNFTKDVASGGVTLTADDLLYVREDGVPAYSESLATFIRSIVFGMNSEEAAKRVLKQFSSVVIAARRLALEPPGKTIHERFRAYVMHLAKRFGRVPTRSEIRQIMFPNSPADRLNNDTREVTRLCDENGLSWLPTGKPGRKKKTKKDSRKSL
jgi:hypothetical protein